jgi:hypothetical protein
MHSGVYGSYLRIYVPPDAVLRELSVAGLSDGPEQVAQEFGLRSFGRFFPVLPGESKRVDLTYETPGTVTREGEDYIYRMHLQKQPGTMALPMSIRIEVPEGSRHLEVMIDGDQIGPRDAIQTDLRVDRDLEVRWQLN